MRHDEQKTESRITLPDDERSTRLSLLVMGSGGVFTYPLPERGEVSVGRSVRCGICIEDPRLSREHALIRVGPPVEIVDLGSSNGTRVGEAALEPNVATPLNVGEAITVGSAMILLQPASAAPRLRHLWSHGYFEARLEDECTRAREMGRPFAVARLRVVAPAHAIEAWLGEHLRPIDIVAVYAPDEYEILLSEVDQRSALALAGRLRSALAPLGDERAQIGIACYPTHARTPEELIARAAPARSEEPQVVSTSARDPIPGGAIDRLRPIVERVAAGAIPVLVVGETGVGKDVLASLIHELSPRAKNALVCVNCAALPENLLESELFGHERGAFTGAVNAKAGLLETADGGTMFLDEVGEMPLSVQAKLLRVLDQREVLRVGGLRPRRIDVRFVAATNRDLELEVRRGQFREDLFYRLNGVLIVVPPLRERVPEIAPLAHAFALQAARDLGGSRAPLIVPAAMAALERYPWPGNVRELRNVIERAVLLAGSTNEITPAHLPEEKLGRVLPVRDSPRAMRIHSSASELHATEPPPRPGRSKIAIARTPLAGQDDRARVIAALERYNGNQTHAAQLLGVSRRTLITRMETYGLPRPRKGVPRARTKSDIPPRDPFPIEDTDAGDEPPTE